MSSASDLPSDPTRQTLETSANVLRFPTPAVDQRISTWVHSIFAATMSARSEGPSEENCLGESAYEFIDTDEESRDDNATESVASIDFGRPDDVASLVDTEGSDNDSGEEDGPESSSVQNNSALHHTVECAFNTPTIARSSTVLLEDVERPLIQSIEFEEPLNLGAETVSVKHTVADFNEEETANALQRMILQNPPRRLVITIRQTMTKQGLSTRDPLRILYVGSHSAKQDIIHKIASSVTASANTGKRAQQLRQSPSQLYNVVPVTAFGSERTPEIELMHSSGYQIEVEDCTVAQTLKFEDNPEKPDVIKLSLEDNFSYHSVPEGRGYIIEPHWELPHVAIFYCSANDDTEARRTTTIARKFMSRHGVPCIVISHKQFFDRGQCMSLDQHSIHMCLESRDPNGRGNIIHRRLPIDLASFLNIDARQMNRNLAYVTGLHEPQDIPLPSNISKMTENSSVSSQDVEKTQRHISDSVNFIHNRNGAEWRALLPVGILLLSVFTAVLTGIPSYRFSSTPAISINSKIMSAASISTSSSALLAPVPSVTSTVASVALKTSTRTITVTHAHSQGPNSLAILPSMEIGKISSAFQSTSQLVNKTSICTAEVLGDREILIRIPSATKLSWLTNEAMSVNLTRGNLTVDTERFYSSDEGIVLLLAKDQAYGILNISIVTTKKPRVNETFQVDFGTTISKTWQSVLEKLSSIFDANTHAADSKAYEQIRAMMDKMADDTRVHSQTTLVQIDEARKIAMEHVVSTSARLTEFANNLSKKLNSLKHFRQPMDNGLLRAQVQSKLLWLKVQGKDVEYLEYQRRATEAIYNRAADLKKSQKDVAAEKEKAQRVAKKVGKKEARAMKKATKKAHS
jgi:hypothetical protein